MADNQVVSNSPFSNNPDIQVRTTSLTAGTGANKHVQHVTIESVFTNYIDEISASLAYYGTAAPGSATSAAVWRIMRKDVAGTLTRYLFADGNANCDNIWDNRASLSYS
jgi:hypothetical protein